MDRWVGCPPNGLGVKGADLTVARGGKPAHDVTILEPPQPGDDTLCGCDIVEAPITITLGCSDFRFWGGGSWEPPGWNPPSPKKGTREPGNIPGFNGGGRQGGEVSQGVGAGAGRELRWEGGIYFGWEYTQVKH